MLSEYNMLEKLIPPFGNRKNDLTVESVGSYIAAILHDPDRAMIRRIVDGVDEDYKVANKKMGVILKSILDESYTLPVYRRLTNALIANKTHPIQRRRKPKVTEESINLSQQVATDQELWGLIYDIKDRLGGRGDIDTISIKIKTTKGDVIKLKGDNK